MFLFDINFLVIMFKKKVPYFVYNFKKKLTEFCKQLIKMSRLESTVIEEDYTEVLGGKEIRPPLIPSNTDKIFTKAGIYNLKGFYEDLSLRLDRQRDII